MINKEPSAIIKEVFAPIYSITENSFLSQHHADHPSYSALHPLIDFLVLGRIHSFFLYPPACFCLLEKKPCLCDQHRQEIHQILNIEGYDLHLKSQRNKQSDDIPDSLIEVVQKQFGLEEKDARQLYLNAKQQSSDNAKKRCQYITGITNDEFFDEQKEKMVMSPLYRWRLKLQEEIQNQKSGISIALGIGTHLIRQIHSENDNNLKTLNGRKGFLSLNKVIMDVLDMRINGSKEICDYHFNFKPPKRVIENTFAQYRSILHLILGHYAVKNALSPFKNYGYCTLYAACFLQNLMVQSAKNTYTPITKKDRIFTENNIAFVPKPSSFMPLFATPENDMTGFTLHIGDRGELKFRPKDAPQNYL